MASQHVVERQSSGLQKLSRLDWKTLRLCFEMQSRTLRTGVNSSSSGSSTSRASMMMGKIESAMAAMVMGSAWPVVKTMPATAIGHHHLITETAHTHEHACDQHQLA